MPSEQVKGDKRRYTRWPVEGRLKGRIGHGPFMSVVDISLGGVLIEHSDIIHLGSISFLNVLFPGKEVSLKFRVIRSNRHRSERSLTGGKELIFRTGLEFLDVTEASRRLISGYIEFLKG